MEITAILGLIAQTIPTVTTLLDTLGVLKNKGTSEAIGIVSSLLPVAQKLMETFTAIKEQTEAQYPEVWAAVRDDYAASSAAFDKLNA